MVKANQIELSILITIIPLMISLGKHAMKTILDRLIRGEITIDEAERLLKADAVEHIVDLANFDIGRENRRGVPELVLAEGKTSGQLITIANRVTETTGRTILTRVDEKQRETLSKAFPRDFITEIFSDARIIVVKQKNFKIHPSGGRIAIATAGTSDMPVAKEAAVIAREMGCEVQSFYDIGVAGIHRIFPALKEISAFDPDVLIVVAGREGALPTVMSGLVETPIIGVPASSGYGYAGKGESALGAILQACSLGIAVVNIDAGVAAGIVAALIANRVAKFRKPAA